MARTFSVQKFITQEFGGPVELHGALAAAGFEGVAAHSMYKYGVRNSMPGPVLAQAILVREEQTGKPLRMADYFEGEEGCSQGKQGCSGAQASIFD